MWEDTWQDKDSPGGSASLVPKLMVVGTGSGGPCIDFRRVSAELAEVSKSADFVRLQVLIFMAIRKISLLIIFSPFR